MNKLIGKMKCFFGHHDWKLEYKLLPYTEINKCKRCYLFQEKDTLLNNTIRYYRMHYP